MTLRAFLTSLVFTLLLLTTTVAQLPAPLPESKEEKEKAQKELEHKALVMLDETLAGAQAFKLAENRALIEAQAADLLWKRDEKRARDLFREAMTDVGEALASTSGRSSRRDMSYWVLVQLRQQTLQQIAAHDPQMALELLRATRPLSEENREDAEGFMSNNQDLRLEQAIASQAALNDPKRALQMAQESLNKGVTLGLISVLQRLQQKDAEAATRLGSDIVKKLQVDSPTVNYERSFVAMELLRAVLMPSNNDNGQRAPADKATTEKAKPFSLDETTVRDLAGVVVSDALKQTLGGPNLLMQLQPMLPELEKRLPERAAQLRRKIGELNQSLDPQTKAWMQFESVARGGSTDAIVEAAAKAPAELRSGLYTMAAMKLMQTGETDRARKLITENMSGQERDQMLTQLDRIAVMRALEQGKLDEIRQLVSGISSKERRASALAQLAAGLAAKGDRKSALQLLEEARALVSRQPDSQKEIEALLEVARGYALVEPARTFELIDPLIDQANEMLAAAALLEKFGSGPGIFRKNEMILQPGLNNLGGQYARFIKALAELARVNFDRTRATADRFSRDEVRIMARLIIAQSVLSDRPEVTNEQEGMFGFASGGGYLVGN